MSNALPNVERANCALSWAWRKGLLTEPTLGSTAVEQAALRGRPSVAFGPDDHWREPFERLLASLRDEADLNPLGRTMAYSQIVAMLRARLKAMRLWQSVPQILEREIEPPIIVLGQMRSGTTRMQRLLSCDPRLGWTRASETLTPVPQPGRTLRAHAILAALRLLNPETLRIHPTDALSPEEEFGWLAFGFGSSQFEAQWRVPSFTQWWEQADVRPLYGEFAALLKTNAHARNMPHGTPWVLKTPHHLQDLPVLLETFPNARLILLHRPIDEVVASSASLVWNQMRIQSDVADKAWIGREWLRKTELRAARLNEALQRIPESSVVHVQYADMNRDWRREMQRVYASLDLELTPNVLSRMERWLGSAQSHLGHRYSLDEFGLGDFSRGDTAFAR